MAITGFFVDWNGNTRRFEAPGDGFRCELYCQYGGDHQSVDVIDANDFVVHEGTFFATLDDIVSAGVRVVLV